MFVNFYICIGRYKRRILHITVRIQSSSGNLPSSSKRGRV